MLNFLCFFVLLNAMKTDKKFAPYGQFFYYLTYQDKIKNPEGYIFEKCFTIKNFGKDFWFCFRAIDNLPSVH